MSFIRQILEYGSPAWDEYTATDVEKLGGVQLSICSAARVIVTGAFVGTANAKLCEELGWETLSYHRKKCEINPDVQNCQ